MVTLDGLTETKMTDDEEKKKPINWGKPVKVVAVTAACAGVGIIGAIGAVTCCAVSEVVLPAVLCMKVAGITGGAIGLVLGIGKKKGKSE